MSREEQIALFEQIKAGKIIFIKGPSGWLVWGQADQITEKSIVTVTKRDGSTEKVFITRINNEGNFDGVAYRYAEFGKASYNTAPATAHCTHDETDNRGVCYSCGRYVSSHDVGSFAW